MRHHQFRKSFNKAFEKRIKPNPKLAAKTKERMAMFASGKRDYPLNDHALIGTMVGMRSFSITSDIRVIYIETEEAIVFLDIGTHTQVYE